MARSGNESVRFRGSMTALVTPFSNGEIDLPALRKLVHAQIAGGTDVLVPCGTTGESPTLTAEEQTRVLSTVMEQAKGKHLVLAGTGTNCTTETIRRTKHAATLGAHGALVVTPYYNRPSQDGLFRHYAAIAEAVELPLVLYNVPKRTGTSLEPQTVAELRKRFRHVVAIKHATGAVEGVDRLLASSDIDVLSGDDALTWPLMAMGAVGVISVLSNLEPALMKRLVEQATSGAVEAARITHRKVSLFCDALGEFGPNPVPIKAALALRGACREDVRLPLSPLASAAREKLAALMRQYEML